MGENDGGRAETLMNRRFQGFLGRRMEVIGNAPEKHENNGFLVFFIGIMGMKETKESEG